LGRTRKLGISSYNPSEHFGEEVTEISGNEINREVVDVKFLSSFDGDVENEHMERDTPFKELVMERGDNECQPENTSNRDLKRPSLKRRNISTQSEDDMFESLFDLRQCASYDVTANHGAWRKLRTLCRKITESKQFTFIIMSAILLNMICMGLEHYKQVREIRAGWKKCFLLISTYKFSLERVHVHIFCVAYNDEKRIYVRRN